MKYALTFLMIAIIGVTVYLFITQSSLAKETVIKDSPLVNTTVTLNHSLLVVSDFEAYYTNSIEAKTLNKIGVNIDSILSCAGCNQGNVQQLDKYFKPNTPFKITKHTLVKGDPFNSDIKYVVLENNGYAFSYPEFALAESINYKKPSGNDRKAIPFEKLFASFKNDKQIKEISIIFNKNMMKIRSENIDRYDHLKMSSDGERIIINSAPILEALTPYNAKHIETGQHHARLILQSDRKALAFLLLNQEKFDIQNFMVKTAEGRYSTVR